MRPESPPPLLWGRERGKRLRKSIKQRVKASITWRLGAKQRLEKKIEKERAKKIENMDKACRLREKADECDRRVALAEKNLEEWTKELEAVEKLLADHESSPKDNSGQFKTIFTGGLAAAIRGAGSHLGHIINDAGSRLLEGPQRIPQFKPMSPMPGSLAWKV